MAKKNVKKIEKSKSTQKVAQEKSAKKVVKAFPSRSKKVVKKSDDLTLGKRIPVVAMVVFGALFVISLVMLFRQVTYSSDNKIVRDVQELKQIMEGIHKDCTIIDLEHTQNYVDFLTVEKFVGSEVGAVNLTYPQNWKGPYLKDNPTVQQQQYIILKNKNGYYIVPGDGVKLGNGKTIGKDIILDETSDVHELLQDSNALKSSEGILGASLDIGAGYVRKILSTPLRYL